MLDISRLENVRPSGQNLTALCPACSEEGSDSSGDHLFISDGGRGGYACIKYRGPDGAAHRKRIFQLAGLRTRTQTPIASSLSPVTPKVLTAVRLSDLRALNEQEMAQISRLRGWPHHEGLKHLTARGLLWFGMVLDDHRHWPAWVITDTKRYNVQARRLDCRPWVGIGCKAKSLPGSCASWPIGAADIGDRPIVLLCEGQPDFCAALNVAIWEDLDPEMVAPVCMTGAGNMIHPEALRYFVGKRVRIIAQTDEAGRNAADRWGNQLSHAGAKYVDRAAFRGLHKNNKEPVKDLADFATILDASNPPKHQITAGLSMAYCACV
jgi:hypothetical protein